MGKESTYQGNLIAHFIVVFFEISRSLDLIFGFFLSCTKNLCIYIYIYKNSWKYFESM